MREVNGQQQACIYEDKTLKKGIFYVRILEIRNGKLIIDGLDRFSESGREYGLIAVDDEGRFIYPGEYPWRLSDKKDDSGETVYYGRRYRFEIPLTGAGMEISFHVADSDKLISEVSLRFGMYGKLSAKLKNSFYARDGYIVKRNGRSGLSIKRAGRLDVLKEELSVCAGLIKERRFRIAAMRLLARLMRALCRRSVWVIRDNERRARDSGAEMFRYYHEAGLKKDINAYFILDKRSEDYPRVSKFGKVVEPYGFRYKMLHLICSVIIDTRGEISAGYVFGDDRVYLGDLCDWDYIWIIHGVMARNFASWMNRFRFNAKLVITTNKREYESVIEDLAGYGYFEKEVVQTGLPRFDALRDNRQKKILFLPTWRKDLAGRVIQGTDEREYVENFRDTDFAKFYNSLINDSRLLEAMEKHGYTGEFYLHPSFIKQAGDIDGNSLIETGWKAADANRLICECSLLVTDFSSAQFEAAYLDRPVVYSQFDADIYNERHTGEDGYFSWREDGFGPVCTDEKSTVDAIISCIENGCVNAEPYRTRAESFFRYRDHENSRRVYEEITKL